MQLILFHQTTAKEHTHPFLYLYHQLIQITISRQFGGDRIESPGCVMLAAAVATQEWDVQFLVCHCPSLHAYPDDHTFTVMGKKEAKTVHLPPFLQQGV